MKIVNCKLKIIVGIPLLAVLLFLVIPYLAQAALVPCYGVTCSFCDLFKLLGNIFDFVVKTITPIVATGFIIWGGFKFITSAGNPTGISAARKILFNTLVGVVIVYASFVLASGLVAALAGQTGGSKFGFNGTSFTFVCSSSGPRDVTDGFATGGDINLTLTDTEYEEPAPVDPAQIQPATGTQIQGGNIKLANRDVNIDDLEPVTWAGLSVASRYTILTENGISLMVTSGKRSLAKQNDEVSKNCPVRATRSDACNPDTCLPRDTDNDGAIDGRNCPHVSGQAVDVWGWQNNQQCGDKETLTDCQRNVIQVMKAQGFCVLASEHWHFEKPKVSAGCN